MAVPWSRMAKVHCEAPWRAPPIRVAMDARLPSECERRRCSTLEQCVFLAA